MMLSQVCSMTMPSGWKVWRYMNKLTVIGITGTGEEKPDAHHKRQVMGREVVVAITEERLDFGPWEQIFMASSMDVVASA
jgi:thiamine phosphate synthase YjbQ (UPF0047 family)